ncbi:MAG: hypothetical protein COA47_09380 [Robiginitomaculum sp.]|nr:MAG: hypothetical protein COA47_09380 [Robiginitomaculum sp.]
MKIVIQCAGRKRPDASHLRDANGRPILFVAKPDIAPETPNFHHAHPDDINLDGISWRDQLIEINKNPKNNPLNLSTAGSLYLPLAYRNLIAKFGKDQIYILSAGWGLIASDFLTPAYDITFSQSAEAYKHRRKKDHYNDFTMLKSNTDEPVIFLGGKDYIPLFCKLTSHITNQRIVVYNSGIPPDPPGCNILRYHTSTRTNWHYQCAQAIIDNKFSG